MATVAKPGPATETSERPGSSRPVHRQPDADPFGSGSGPPGTGPPGDAEEGVRVVSASGPAEAAGIRSGDVIIRLNNRSIDGVSTFEDVADGLESGKSVPVLVVRGQTPRFLALRVPQD